ncbi:MAG: bifunctional 4-hydroxy-2-oxoglutarate aldolase/2-dehydro-3-deoxy-phosphogluconate aldolase [Vicinamibacterales bacterium]
MRTNLREDTLDAIESTGVVAIVRLGDSSAAVRAAEALLAGGIRALEVTMTVPGAVSIIAALAATLPRDVVLGAGTVLDVATARAVIDAGARFVVSPVYRAAIVDTCRSSEVASVPGCFSPTEMLDAWERGADIVKLFPAASLGPSFIKDVRAPLPQLRVMPTGGVTAENAGVWIRAGACAVGVGSSLADEATVSAGRFDVIEARARTLLQAVALARRPATEETR